MKFSLSRSRTICFSAVAGLLLLTGATLPGGYAVAAETKAANPETGKRFAAVWRIRGEVLASGGVTGKDRQLREGDPVFVGERVHATSSAEAVLKTDDAGIVAVRPGAEFVAERFAAQGDANDSLTLRILTGSLRIITGWIGRTNQAGHRVVTPSATIGIRGTDHEPYVLSPDMLAAATNKPGTYDKVNRGGTTLDVNGQSLDIDAGRVGFVRLVRVKERALLTLLLPALLDKVPDFYVPGEFDAELDLYSQTADETALQQLEKKRKSASAKGAAVCVPKTVAKQWLDRLDRGIAKGDADAIVAMFAPDVEVRAVVILKDGSTSTVVFGRQEMVQSTLAAMKTLKDYKHRRLSLDAGLANPEATAECTRLKVKSVVIEQGIQAGKRFRFESQEEYLLELQAGTWLAIKAETTQR
ncbi:hypothetical protein [Propionivibrio sp.]|uniref:hypothetical protein n=1 Tax=Propionivibrio sp. TaxID=2212460 RepID=UPI003BF12B68